MTTNLLSKTAGDLIRMALVDSKAVPVEQPIEAVDFETGLERLQLMFKHWQGQGIHLWTKEEAVLPLITDRRSYLLGSGDECGVADTFVNTTLDGALVTDDTDVTVTDATGIEAAPTLLAVDAGTSLNGWVVNLGELLLSSGRVLLVADGGGLADADYIFDVEVGKTYAIRGEYEKGSATDMSFNTTSPLNREETVVLTASGEFVLTFEATSETVTFGMAFSDGAADTNFLPSLNICEFDTGDRIGIELDDDTRYWDEVAFIDGNDITLRGTWNEVEGAGSDYTGVTSAAADNNSVYSYETAIDRPLRILQSRFGENIARSEIPTHQVSREKYFNQPDKDSTGTVVWWYYSPQLTLGELFVWQVASSVNQVLRFTYERPIKIPTSPSDTLDIPEEWFNTVKWGLAAEVGPSYGVPAQEQASLDARAASHLEAILAHDVERDEMAIQPEYE